MTIKLTGDDVSGDFVVAVTLMSIPVSKAAQLAIKNAGGLLLQSARGHIARVGFSEKWQRAYKVKVYPEKGNSIDAAAFGLFKNIDYSDIFATGGRIKGSHLLWIPFGSTPKIDKRKTEADIRDYKNAGVKMVSFKSKHGAPLMAAPVMMTRTQSRRTRISLTLNEIKTGAKKLSKKTKAKNPTLVKRNVPLFQGVSSIQIKKRFDWDKVQESVQNQVPALYEAAINKLADE